MVPRAIEWVLIELLITPPESWLTLFSFISSKCSIYFSRCFHALLSQSCAFVFIYLHSVFILSLLYINVIFVISVYILTRVRALRLAPPPLSLSYSHFHESKKCLIALVRVSSLLPLPRARMSILSNWPLIDCARIHSPHFILVVVDHSPESAALHSPLNYGWW